MNKVTWRKPLKEASDDGVSLPREVIIVPWDSARNGTGSLNLGGGGTGLLDFAGLGAGGGILFCGGAADAAARAAPFSTAHAHKFFMP